MRLPVVRDTCGFCYRPAVNSVRSYRGKLTRRRPGEVKRIAFYCADHLQEALNYVR